MKTFVKSLLAFAALLASTAAPATADFGIESFEGKLSNADGTPVTQAGSHPWSQTVDMRFPQALDELGLPVPAENVRTAAVDLPPGFMGSAKMPRCSTVDFQNVRCADRDQVGNAFLHFTFFTNGPLPLYNLVPPPGVVARFGMQYLGGIPIFIDAKVSPDGDIVTAGSYTIDQTLPLIGSTVNVWGVPADPSHDAERGNEGLNCDDGTPSPCPARSPRRPLLTMPTACSATPHRTALRADSWQDPGDWHTASFDHDSDGNSMIVDGCEALSFDPSIDVDVDSSGPDSPTGLTVGVSVPQNDGPDGLAAAHLRDAQVTLPEGMSINPAGADGLAACTDEQLGLDQDTRIACPEASKIGTVTAVSPLLDEQLSGGVYVLSQRSGDPESGEMFRLGLGLVSEERGVNVKLAGSVRADAETGRLTTSFVDNPQTPVSNVTLRFKGGPRAPLASPPTCGTKTVDASFTAWNGKAVETADTFTIPCAGERGFAPRFTAGTANPTGGAFSPFLTRIRRPDGAQNLSGVQLDMPEGLLARLASVTPCADAAAGSCGEASRVGSATVGAGAGSPFFIERQPVYLAGSYKGAPYSLSVAVRAVAGPYDLGMVVVRQALHVDPRDAHVTVVSDPLPQIVGGVPLRLRSIDVDVDRAGFTVNPTSCAPKRIDATLTSIDGAVHRTGSRFQSSDCRALGFKPRLGLRLTGKRQTRTGGHPALHALLRQGKGQANVDQAKVTLPPSLALDAKNAYDPKLVCDYDAAQKADCPASSVIGKASLRTPLLSQPLAGAVHLVQGIRFGPSGNRIRSLPTLLVKLRGQIAIDLRSRTAIDRRDRLVSTFANVPDAAASRFALTVNGGSKGILVVTRTRKGKIDVCSAKQTARIETDGQNGRRADYSTRVKTPCRAARGQSRPR